MVEEEVQGQLTAFIMYIIMTETIDEEEEEDKYYWELTQEFGYHSSQYTTFLSFISNLF